MAKTRDPRNETVLKNLKRFRAEARLTTEEAAQASGVPVDNIRRYESGGSGVPADVLRALAQIYGHPMDDFYLENPPKPDLESRPVWHLRALPGATYDEEKHRKIEEFIAKMNAEEIRAKKAKVKKG